MTQFRCSDPNPLNCPSIITLVNGAPVSVPRHLYVAQFLDFDEAYSGYGTLMGWLVLTIVVMHLLVAITTRFVRHIKR
jgi:hypothetical protein